MQSGGLAGRVAVLHHRFIQLTLTLTLTLALALALPLACDDLFAHNETHQQQGSEHCHGFWRSTAALDFAAGRELAWHKFKKMKLVTKFHLAMLVYKMLYGV